MAACATCLRAGTRLEPPTALLPNGHKVALTPHRSSQVPASEGVGYWKEGDGEAATSAHVSKRFWALGVEG